MRLLLPLAAVFILGFTRNLPHHHKAHKRHVDRVDNVDHAVRALQDEELRAWEDDQRVRRQLANSDMSADEKMRMAEEHWQRFSTQRRRGGCKGRYRPAPPGQIRRRCPPRSRTPSVHGEAAASNQQYPNYSYYPSDANLDNAAYEAERLEHEARLKQYEADRAAAEAQRAIYEEQYRAAELRRAEEEERYRVALMERKQQEEESARVREDEERRHYELNEQRQRDYEEMLRQHRDQQDNNESVRRRAPCPALRHDILDGKTYEQIFLFAHKSGCSEHETRMAIDMARRQRIEQYFLKYDYPVLFYSRTRGWIKINNEPERLRFEEQEADIDFERLRAQYKFVTEIEANRTHPHHAPAYTEEELGRAREQAEKEAEREKEREAEREKERQAEEEKERISVIDKDNNEAVAYGNEEGKPVDVVDAIVLPEDTIEEEPKAAPTADEIEREEEAKKEEKEALVDAVIKAEEEEIEKEKQKKEEDAREEERLKEEQKKAEEEKEAAEKASDPVEKELPEEEVAEEGTSEDNAANVESKEIEVEDPLPVIPDIGDEVVIEPPESSKSSTSEVKEEAGEEVVIPVQDEVKQSDSDATATAATEQKEVPKAEGSALEYDPNEQPW